MSRLSVLERAQLTPAFAELAEKNALTEDKEKKASGGMVLLGVASDE